ncbi:MarR family winged helix-turn-helix transcriptional regulator [Micromonospora aurantiaca (nom. illeg.)]|uniref:MarR family winged helix-turn-helix transcriptional regulator n=1 Tax=Micromonospora aurantiaca (nom. illeg.) TaxID=47850 RepID=UPI0037BC03DF
MNAATRRPALGIYRPPVNGRTTRRIEPDAVAQLCRTANTVRAYLERTVLREAGMTWTTYDVLVLVCARQVVEPPVIAAEVGIARATLTKTLAVLSDRDLVRRELHEHDLRRVVVRPTPAGLALAGMLRRWVDARQADLFAAPGMPPEQDVAQALKILADRSRLHTRTVGEEGVR